MHRSGKQIPAKGKAGKGSLASVWSVPELFFKEMNIHFQITYETHWGEEVRVCGNLPELGGGDELKAPVMHTTDGKNWTLDVGFASPPGEFTYYYAVTEGDRLVTTEWHLFPRFMQPEMDDRNRYRTADQWKMVSGQQYFYSSAFTDCLLARKQNGKPLPFFRRTLVLKAHFPRLSDEFALALVGNQPQLGMWNLEEPLVMNDSRHPEWQAALDADSLTLPLEYKFVLYNKKEKRAVKWELLEGNRRIETLEPELYDVDIRADHYVYFDQPVWRGAGVAVPVFSLRSEESFGCGDFGDLKKLVDWAVKTHQKVIQILPIYDTTKTHDFTDSYPYSSISIYAFHPMYLNLGRLGRLKKRGRQAFFDRLAAELNALPWVDYVKMMEAKWDFFREIYAQEGEAVLRSEPFGCFFRENEEWLVPYAAYSFLREKYGTANFNDWKSLSVYDAGAVSRLCDENRTEVGLYYYLQFQLHCQLSEVVDYARNRGVILKGDIPIGISRDSVEAWVEPHYFNMNGQAGAPPDDFSVDGQNWGFPTYNWDVMAADGYRWWMKRFGKMAQYFDAYRIDHILGFFRIWEIPTHSVHGLLGQFAPAMPMSPQEIEAFGLAFDEERFLTPYIHAGFLGELFGEYAQEVKQNYLTPHADGETFSLLPELDTQRKIEAHFRHAETPKERCIRDGLYRLASNVLFLRDHREPEKYHPRISAGNDFFFKHALNDGEREAFGRLYEHFYYHRHNDFWYGQAMKKLPALVGATRMLVCGEDLGMIPACVPGVMNELQILSLEIQRMPKTFAEFADLKAYPYRSICTIGTHDMSTLRGWWKEDAAQTARFYNHVLKHEGEAPAEPDGALCEEVVRAHLESPSMFAILALQDWLAMDDALRLPDAEAERINVPADPRNYWRYRMHLNIEALMEADGLNKRIASLVDRSGRNEVF